MTSIEDREGVLEYANTFGKLRQFSADPASRCPESTVDGNSQLSTMVKDLDRTDDHPRWQWSLCSLVRPHDSQSVPLCSPSGQM
jgi:hypothetical protein